MTTASIRQCHGRCTRAHYATGAAYKPAPGDGPALSSSRPTQTGASSQGRLNVHRFGSVGFGAGPVTVCPDSRTRCPRSAQIARAGAVTRRGPDRSRSRAADRHSASSQSPLGSTRRLFMDAAFFGVVVATKNVLAVVLGTCSFCRARIDLFLQRSAEWGRAFLPRGLQKGRRVPGPAACAHRFLLRISGMG
jgi:hypothetical protein